MRASLLIAAAAVALGCSPPAGPRAVDFDVDVEAAVTEDFRLDYGQTVRVPSADATLTFTDVLEDSRCPQDVDCVWQGNGRIRLRARSATEARDVELNTGREPHSAELGGGYVVRLVGLEPKPISTRRIPPERYTAVLRVDASSPPE